jgi:bifunctional non-homologous end joining protein LigD
VNEDGVLRYAGKVGTGFDNDEITGSDGDHGTARARSPTVEGAARRGARRALDQPKLVAEIAFTEMTNEGTLRHPSYLGLREDKKPEAVVAREGARSRRSPCRLPQGEDQQSRPVIFPESDVTKGQLADHYAAVAPIMLPWAGSRPISLVRCPQGRAKKCFFQKHDAGQFGDYVQQVGSARRTGTRSRISMSTTPTAC